MTFNILCLKESLALELSREASIDFMLRTLCSGVEADVDAARSNRPAMTPPWTAEKRCILFGEMGTKQRANILLETLRSLTTINILRWKVLQSGQRKSVVNELARRL